MPARPPLLNHILPPITASGSPSLKRVCEIGIDNALVINADEEIFEMNNGCICCTVRGDLIRSSDSS